jgi:hypothetical protein
VGHFVLLCFCLAEMRECGECGPLSWWFVLLLKNGSGT